MTEMVLGGIVGAMSMLILMCVIEYIVIRRKPKGGSR